MSLFLSFLVSKKLLVQTKDGKFYIVETKDGNDKKTTDYTDIQGKKQFSL